jgi:hypothetical protein
VALALSASMAVAAEDLPNLDPLDPATCDHEKGFVVVAIAWTNAWADATNSGKLEEPRSTQLAVWFTQMENYLLESNDVKGTCLELISSRKNHKF